jgi:hypothetical protein
MLSDLGGDDMLTLGAQESVSLRSRPYYCGVRERVRTIDLESGHVSSERRFKKEEKIIGSEKHSTFFLGL